MLSLEIPARLQQEFEQRAEQRYGQNGTSQAILEAIELWLAQSRETIAEAEEALNNDAYGKLKSQLEQQYAGKCVVIAHGTLQAAADTFEQLVEVAPNALHRLVFQVGDIPPKERELGWQISFAGPVPTVS